MKFYNLGDKTFETDFSTYCHKKTFVPNINLKYLSSTCLPCDKMCDWLEVQSAKLSKQVGLTLFKGKGAKANNKDNYRGITLFPTLCKIYEMIILNRSEKFASQAEYFLEMQFGFQESSGCTEASFTILETINHMLERGSKMFSCFLDVRKAFDTVWIDGLMYKLIF